MMAAVTSGPWRMARTIPATLTAVDDLCVEVRLRLRGRSSPLDWYGIELLLREALTNAVLHGGGEGERCRVRCKVSMGVRKARLVVTDEGPGFDWRQTLARTTPETATCGRGLKIYGMYADHVSFNEAGNRVVLERRLGQDRAV